FARFPYTTLFRSTARYRPAYRHDPGKQPQALPRRETPSRHIHVTVFASPKRRFQGVTARTSPAMMERRVSRLMSAMDAARERPGISGPSATLGTTSTAIPAASALRVPETESSIAMVFSTGTPRASAAVRYGHGSGSANFISSPVSMNSITPGGSAAAVFSTTERQA